MNGKTIGALIGLVFGVVLFTLGVGEAFAVLALAFFGWFVGKMVSREIDVLNYLESISRRKDTR
jgi:uncharacterized membrane protein